MDKENLATMEFCIAVKKNGMVTFQVNGGTGRYDPESVDSSSERQSLYVLCICQSFFQNSRCGNITWSNHRNQRGVTTENNVSL